MAKPGRISSADLSVVTSFPSQRPPAPEHLSETEKVEWRALTGCMPADWFPRETHAALAALCRHTVRSRLLGAQICKAQDCCFGSEDALRFLDKLLAMLERETRAVAALSRSMRLTQQTRTDKNSAYRMTSGPRPSPYDSMELEENGY